MSDSNSLCKEIHLKLLIDPPISSEFIKFIQPTVSNVERYWCHCNDCAKWYGKDMIQLKLNYRDKAFDTVVVSSDTAAFIRYKYRKRVHLAS